MILRILLTGGPHSGKTTVTRQLREMLEARGVPVVCIAEAATSVIQSMGSKNAALVCQRSRLGLELFQAAVLRTQHANEIVCESLALTIERETRRLRPHFAPIVVLFDRGVSDGQAFVADESMWDSVLKRCECKIDKVGGSMRVYGRPSYDLILHLQSQACLDTNDCDSNNAREEYSRVSPETNTERLHTSAEARKQDDALFSIYSDHRDFMWVPALESFEEKSELVMQFVRHYMHPFFDQTTCSLCEHVT